MCGNPAILPEFSNCWEPPGLWTPVPFLSALTYIPQVKYWAFICEGIVLPSRTGQATGRCLETLRWSACTCDASSLPLSLVFAAPGKPLLPSPHREPSGPLFLLSSLWLFLYQVLSPLHFTATSPAPAPGSFLGPRISPSYRWGNKTLVRLTDLPLSLSRKCT